MVVTMMRLRKETRKILFLRKTRSTTSSLVGQPVSVCRQETDTGIRLCAAVVHGGPCRPSV